METLTRPITRRSRRDRFSLPASLAPVGRTARAADRIAEDRRDVESQLRAILAAYAANDQDAVVGFVDPQGFSFYGSDLAELVESPAALRQLMTDDFRLWRTARFGEVRNLGVRVGPNLASAFFHAPFQAAGQPEVTLRLSTVWRRVGSSWRLSQCAIAAPTVGSSARELLGRW